jgi:hypothetical protein
MILWYLSGDIGQFLVKSQMIRPISKSGRPIPPTIPTTGVIKMMGVMIAIPSMPRANSL